MKLFLLSLFSISLISCSIDSELESWGLRGRVKSVFEQTYEVENKFGQWEQGSLIDYARNYKATFDNKGLYVGTEYYHGDMDMFMKIIPVRKNGNIIGLTTYDRVGKLESRTKIHYLSKNEKVIEEFDAGNNKIRYSKFSLKSGKTVKIVETTFKDGRKNEVYTIFRDYDRKGNLISERVNTEEGKTIREYRFEHLEFDHKGNWVKMIVFANKVNPESILIRDIEYYK